MTAAQIRTCDARAGWVPGACLLRPLPLLAAAVVASNDLWLKPQNPGGWLEGKLSDLGICLLLPVVLVSLWEWAHYALRGARSPASAAVKLAACGITAAYFTMLQLWPAFGELHMRLLARVAPFINHTLYRDPTDLLALVMVPLAYLHLRRP